MHGATIRSDRIAPVGSLDIGAGRSDLAGHLRAYIRPEASLPKREVDVATQHRSRRARAITRQRIDCAQAIEDLRFEDDEALTALVVEEEPLVPQFFPAVFLSESWSVLEAADAVAAMAVADAERLDSLAEQLRAFEDELPVLVLSGRSEAARPARRLRGRTEFASSRSVR